MSDALQCRRCGETKPVSEFRADPRYRRGYGSWCAACHRTRGSEWSVERREHRTAKAAAWRRSNPEKALEISRKFHRLNKAVRAAAHAEWARKNRDKRNAASMKRKAAKLCATPTWANPEKIAEIYREALEIERSTGVAMHVDHIVPLQGETVCGLHWEGNLQILPAAENIAKHNRWDARVEAAYRQPDMFVERPAPPEQLDMLRAAE